LHAHLTGSISRQCLYEIWQTRLSLDPNFTLQNPITAISGKVDYDLHTFFPLFSSYIYTLCSDRSSIEYSTKAVLDEFEADGVVYLELRTTPRAIPKENISKDDYVQLVLQCIKAHNSRPDCKMTSKLILSVDRRWNTVDAEEVVNLTQKYQSSGVVGIDLCGDPSKGDISLFRAPFCRAKDAGIPITLHFAEFDGTSTDKDLSELLSWGPSRLGHVVHVHDDFKRQIVSRQIGVELCLSCNVHAKMIVGSYPDHHFGWWRQHPNLVALGTDDVGIFCSPLSEEYALAARHFDLTVSDVKRLCEGAISQAFASDDEKQRLMLQLDSWFTDRGLA
ncbi:Metallo-dependent hydrolase, partial [Pseudovirgaria hyperparasitica]